MVDTIETAQKCVEYLKKSNVGSATFIGLDKMARWKDHASRKINTYGFFPLNFLDKTDGKSGKLETKKF